MFESSTEKCNGPLGASKTTKHAKCKRCGKNFMCNRSNTSNLWTHLEKNHIDDYVRLVQSKLPKTKKVAASSTTASCQKQTDIRSLFEKSTPYAKDSKEHQDITDSIVNYIAADGRPLSTIDSVAFRSMISALNPRYVPPSRRRLTENEIPKLYLKKKRTIQKEINDIRSGSYDLAMFSFTTDLWSSITMEPYMSLTMHFIDDNFQLHKYCLETKYIPDTHTGVNLAMALSELLASWELTVKDDLMVITTDSASNMIKMGTEAQVTRLPCFGHLLHNGVRKSLEDDEVKKVTAKLKRIVAYFHQSHRRQRKLDAELAKEGKSTTHLISECPTRWGSTFKMYECIRANIKEIKRVLVDDSSHLVPYASDEEVINSVCEALSELSSMTDGLSGDKTTTCGMVLPMVDVIRGLKDDENLQHDRSRTLRNGIYDYVNSK